MLVFPIDCRVWLLTLVSLLIDRTAAVSMEPECSFCKREKYH
jgi:hypothetical protein